VPSICCDLPTRAIFLFRILFLHKILIMRYASSLAIHCVLFSDRTDVMKCYFTTGLLICMILGPYPKTSEFTTTTTEL
jgi:hypothetical protein